MDKAGMKRYGDRVRTMATAGVIVLLIAFLGICLQRAWLADDAYISFRTVDNFVRGYNLTWNAGERVQAYTHPLWLFLLSLVYFFSHEIYLTSIILCLIVSITAAVLFATQIARSPAVAALGILILGLSNAYVDYSTSGLENPLSHLLLVIFFLLYLSKPVSTKSLFVLSLVASLVGLNRLDCLLLVAPALLLYMWELRSIKGIGVALAGQIPLILWECFSLIYYGFLFPNTAYAKLNTGIPFLELAGRGLYFLFNSLQHDPLTLIIVTGTIILTITQKDKLLRIIAAGILLYLLYIIKIGGDFMSGRFLTTPLLCSVIIVGRSRLVEKLPTWVKSTIAVGVIACGLLATTPTFSLQTLTVEQINDRHGITDQRQSQFWETSLFREERFNTGPVVYPGTLQARADSEKDYQVIQAGAIGVKGFYAGQNVYVIDIFGIADPLLARLPPVRELDWRAGHLSRVIPLGYAETLYWRENRLEDKSLAEYYDQLWLITRGSLFDPRRLTAIWKINTGQLDYLIDYDTYRYPDRITIDYAQVQDPKKAGTPWDAEGVTAFTDDGLQIDLDDISKASKIEVSLDSNDDYEIDFLSEKAQLGNVSVQASNQPAGLALYTIDVPASVSQRGFDNLHILPLKGDPKMQFSLGHLRLME